MNGNDPKRAGRARGAPARPPPGPAPPTPARAHHTLHGCSLSRFLRTDRLVDEYQFKRFVSFRFVIPIVFYRFSFLSFLHPIVSCRFVSFTYRFIVSFRLVSMTGLQCWNRKIDECISFLTHVFIKHGDLSSCVQKTQAVSYLEQHGHHVSRDPMHSQRTSTLNSGHNIEQWISLCKMQLKNHAHLIPPRVNVSCTNSTAQMPEHVLLNRLAQCWLRSD